MITDAILNLRPGASFIVRGVEIEWLDTEQTQPSEAEITAEIARLQAEHERTEYQRKRAVEYPPMADYLDAVVKGDQAQVDAYIAACLAVKAKYPKPE
jgi:hypothetical protein